MESLNTTFDSTMLRDYIKVIGMKCNNDIEVTPTVFKNIDDIITRRYGILITDGEHVLHRTSGCIKASPSLDFSTGIYDLNISIGWIPPVCRGISRFNFDQFANISHLVNNCNCDIWIYKDPLSEFIKVRNNGIRMKYIYGGMVGILYVPVCIVNCGNIINI